MGRAKRRGKRLPERGEIIPDRAPGRAGFQRGDRKVAPATVRIFRGWCKSCGVCVEFCPQKCLAVDPHDGSPILAYPERCTHCGLCDLRCPEFAIIGAPSPEAAPSPDKEKRPKEPPVERTQVGEAPERHLED